MFAIESQVKRIINSLERFDANPIAGGYVPPFVGEGEIRLIILGQDPTVTKVEERNKVQVTLNLDREEGVLWRHVNKVCQGLGLEVDNIYATNVFKYFYTDKPTKNAATQRVLQKHAKPNIKLLKEELEVYPNLPIITLGEPILKLLTYPKNKVQYYWDYDENDKTSHGHFTHVAPSDNELGRDIFPFVHANYYMMRNRLYKDNFYGYLEYVKKEMKRT